MALNHGNQAVVRYVEEAAAGTFPTNPALVLFSKELTRARWLLDRNTKESADVDDYDVDSHYSVTNAYGFEVEFVAYDFDAVSAFLARNSDSTTDTFSFEVIPNQDAATVHYYRGSGWSPTSVRVSGRVDEAYVVSITFTGGTWDTPVTVDPGVGVGSRQAKSGITDARRTFSSGAITLNGSAWATLVNDFEFTVEQNAEAQYTTGSADPVAGATVYGKRQISGTCSFSLDDGAKTFWDLVEGGSTHTIVVPFSTTTGQPKITFTGVTFPRFEAEVAADSKVLMASQPFMATTYTVGTV